ncbi:MAG: hypothetical protein HOP08_10525 [Cyclobacteriaceae bacterium]|nr:hypothetical protein [Cyclobacteriaceae bacterium]
MKKIPVLIGIALLISTQSCYIAKPLDHDVRVSINTDFPVIITNTGTSNFSALHTEAEYRESYLKELKNEFTNDHIIIDEASPEFIVKISSLEISESTKTDTVKDVKSKDNGLIRDLTLGNLKTSGTVAPAAGGNSVKWSAEKDKDERLDNARNVGQMITGENKDNTVYTEKGFDENEFVVQSGHCGRRAAVRIVKDIQGLLKK